MATLWVFHAAILAASPGTSSDAAWEMPVDQATHMLLARAELMQAAGKSQGQATRSSESGGWEDLGGGRKRMRITSCDQLRAAMKSGLSLKA